MARILKYKCENVNNHHNSFKFSFYLNFFIIERSGGNPTLSLTHKISFFLYSLPCHRETFKAFSGISFICILSVTSHDSLEDKGNY